MTVINTNVGALRAQNGSRSASTQLSTAMERLSTGKRINSAKDDAAGLAIASRMNAEVRGMNVAIRNANDGISLAQTAEGALGEISNMLQRMRELAVQSANATNGLSDRQNLDAEYKQFTAEIDRTLSNTRFNGLAILGADSGPQVFQVGADAGDQITITTADLVTDMAATGIATGDLLDATNSTTALGNIDAALTLVNGERAQYGATQNRFEAVIGTLQVSAENQTAARGRIMDADFAVETANLSRAQILQQAGTAMVAQANQLPQQVLQLLKG